MIYKIEIFFAFVLFCMEQLQKKLCRLHIQKKLRTVFLNYSIVFLYRPIAPNA